MDVSEDAESIIRMDIDRNSFRHMRRESLDAGKCASDNRETKKRRAHYDKTLRRTLSSVRKISGIRGTNLDTDNYPSDILRGSYYPRQ